MPTVRDARPDDLPAIGRTLAAAFADDPVWAFLTPKPHRYRRSAPRFFSVDAAAGAGPHGRVLVDDQVRGVAVWAAPDHWKGTWRQTARLALPSLLLFGTRTPHAVQAQTTLQKAHPRQPPHWYLSLLGTDPAHQGLGIGSALLRGVTDRCDDEGVPAFLESSKEANVSYYARHGFEVTDVVHLPRGGPPLWLMWREPR